MACVLAKRYRPKLANIMSLCASNYMLLMRILADCEQAGQQRSFAINASITCVIDVIEVTRLSETLSRHAMV